MGPERITGTEVGEDPPTKRMAVDATSQFEQKEPLLKSG